MNNTMLRGVVARYKRSPRAVKTIKLQAIYASFAVLLGMCEGVRAQVPEWELWLKSARPEQRLRAVETLTKSGNVVAILDLVDHDDPFVRAACISALIGLGRAAIDPLLVQVRSDDAAMRAKGTHTLLNLLGRDKTGGPTLSPDIEAEILQELASLRCFEGACLRSWVRPVYGLARNSRIEGRVWVSFRIDNTGQPESISTKGHPLLASAVETAIKKWRFSKDIDSSTVRHSILFDFYLIPPADYSNKDAVEMMFPNYVVTHGRPFTGSIDYGDVLQKQ